jgi:4-aminobutyrate aminotransferase-like enzyme
MTKSLERDAKYLSPALGRAHHIVAVKGEGSFLFDEAGDKYLDLTSGIAVNQIGHAHPEVVQAIAEQAAKCIHTSCVVHYPANIDLAEKLASIMPGNISSTFFCNSGAEAVDGAMKLIKIANPGRANIFVHKGSFHGRTLAATALTTSKNGYRKFYDPLIPGVHTMDFPNIYAQGTKKSREFLVKHLKDIFNNYTDTITHPETISAIFIEPVLGEGGYIPAPGADQGENYLQFLRDYCDEHGILLVFDEVQCGFGRTGKMFASEYYGVVPDIQIMAKGLSGGVPLGAFSASFELMNKMPVASHGSTWGGNPIACRASLKLLEIIERDNVIANVNARSEQVFKFFEKHFPNSDTRKTVEENSEKTNDPKRGHTFSAYHNPKVQVRGLGLMLAIVLPDNATALKVKEYCFKNKILTLGCGTHGNIIRLAPDLTITEANLQIGLDAIAEAIKG